MRLIAAALLAATCVTEKKPVVAIDAAPPPDAEKAPPAVVAPRLAPVEGASADAGRELFAQRCAGCHGADGRGRGPQAAGLRLAPTDLTTTDYLCRSTSGRDAVPSEADVEGALGRGTHRDDPRLGGMSPPERRSLTLYVMGLAPEFLRVEPRLAAVEPEPADSPESRARGRTLYFAFGCWRCHGTDGRGGGEGLAIVRWNDRPVRDETPLAARDRYLCGAEPERVYLTIALGMGGRTAIMPSFAEFAEAMGRPEKGTPEEWTDALEGKIPEADLRAVREFYVGQPPLEEVRALKPSARRKRGGESLWDLVHYVRSL
jgi:mono/diheme cytochrome c family protein